MAKRITNAVLAERIDGLKSDLGEVKECIKDFNDVKTDLAVTKDRQRFWNVGLAILNVTIGAVATAIGVRR